MKIAKIEISHPEKLLYPDDNISKKEVSEYYSKISQYLLPFVKDRPITMKRYPDGLNKDGFFNKHRPDYFPDFIDNFTVPTREDGFEMSMVGIHSEKGLAYLANQNVLELHVALSTMSSIEKPDQIIFDFDPSEANFENVRSSAKALKSLLDNYDIKSFVKTSGSRGLHVHIPIKPQYEFKIIKKIARTIAEELHEQCSDITTLEQRKEKRSNKVYIDILRNDYAMTAIAPYSLRAKKGAPVAAPLNWEELDDKSLNPSIYNLKNIFQRLGQIENPWENFNHFNRQIDLKICFKNLE
ncbi:DNA ligase [Legionella norrlandica]|uniref:DNA ligase n=1 Tax=Legionella norrlandica TaxID=1498499 RepID=A0A0A2SQ96_9GAMM|nr:non-homologous end-joining DNA ligase [Legionella norrlandica]KGP62887.1 DNA ligase [Legionella norrlandica]